MKTITIEQVDKEIEAIEKSTSQGVTQKQAAAIDINTICNVVNKVKPILKFIRGFLFFKPKWQKIIDDVINATSICDAA